ncbi:sulfotransferase family 2 domain-containing protein [Oricola sp.]|uniref:sulfotransferase family 2 domain-containing protein n=1 Tax=Oricola sp. TaxID=1979950 RepID=UPI003BAC6051
MRLTRNKSDKIHTEDRPKLLKTIIRAPFSGRHRNRLAFFTVPYELIPVVRLSLLSSDGRYMYIRNSKAACSAVTQTIHHWETGEFSAKNVHIQPVLRQGNEHLHSLAKALTDPNVYRFSFVRDPLARALSGFSNFFLDNRNKQRKHHIEPMTRMGFSPDKATERNFDVFLDYVERCIEEEPIFMDAHFRPQFYNLRPDLVKYDRIGKVHNLSGELRDLAEVLGLPEPAGIDKPQFNVSMKRYEATPEQVQRVRRIYAKDYAEFQFETPASGGAR